MPPNMNSHALYSAYREVEQPPVSPAPKYLPYALARKYPNAGREWPWQCVFPARDGSVDPDLRLLEAYALVDGRWQLLAILQEDAEVRLPPFEAVGFPLSSLWAD